MAEPKVVAPEIKVVIGIMAAILALIILTLTFVGGLYIGRWTDRSNVQTRMGPGGQMMQQGPGQGGGQGQLRNRIQELGGTAVRGQVKSINGNTLTVTTQEGEKKVTLSSDVTVQKGQAAATASDINVGDRVVAVGELASDGTLEAKLVRIMAGQGPGGF